MTTLKDYTNDLVIELLDKVTANIDGEVILPSDEEIDDAIDEFIEIIKNRLIGE